MAFPNYPGLADLSGRKPPKKSSGQKYTDDEIAALERDRDVAAAREEGRREALAQAQAARPPAPRQTAPEDVPPPAPGEPPDSSTDPAAFKDWLARDRAYERWRSRAEALKIRDEAVGRTRSEQIIDNYLMQNPQYRELRPIVIEAYRQAIAEMQLAELPENTAPLDALAHRKVGEIVTAAAQAVADDVKDTSLPRDGEPSPPRRTGGLSGGSRGSNPPRGSKFEGDESERPVPLFDALRDRQAKTGLF